MADTREQLIEFLEKRAFSPVLDKSEDDYESDHDRKKLREVKDATEREVERFRGRDSVEGVIDEFKGDMNSEPADEITRKLHSLDLPALQDMEGDFRKKVEELGHDY